MQSRWGGGEEKKVAPRKVSILQGTSGTENDKSLIMVIRRKFIGYWIATDRMKRLYSWQKIRKQKIKVERGVDN